MRHIRSNTKALQLGLAVSTLIFNDYALADDRINIIPAQQQVDLNELGIFTLKFDVENRTGTTQELKERIHLPDGWQLLTESGSFLLSGNARETRLVHVVAPRGTNAGLYNIQYQIYTLNNNSTFNQQNITVRITEQSDLKLTRIKAPSNLLANEHYTATFLLENTGNKETAFIINAKDNQGFIQEISPKRITLKANASHKLSVKGKIPANIKNIDTYTLKLSVRGAGKTKRETIKIPIISQSPLGLSKYQKLAGTLKTRHTQRKSGDLSSSLTQIEYRAKGTLDEAGKHQLSLELKTGKSSEDTALFNQQSRYFATYTNKNWKIEAGHQNFYASSLLGNSLNGIGIKTHYKTRNKQEGSAFSIEAFHGKSRASDENARKVTAVLAEYQWKNYSFGSTVLQHNKKNDATQLSMDELIASVSAKWQHNGYSAKVEVAQDNQQKQAISTHVSGQWGKLGANASYIKAAPGFAGGYANTTRIYANTSYRIDDKTRINANFRYTRDTEQEDENQEQRQDNAQTISISRTFGEKEQAEVTLKHSQRREKDLRPNPTTDRNIQSTILEYRHRFETIDLLASLEHGTRKDNIDTSSDGFKKSLSLNWRPNDDIRIGSNYSESDNLDTAGKQQNLSFHGRYQFNERSSLSGSIQRSQNTHLDSSSNSLDARYEHRFRDGKRISFQARHVESNAPDSEQINDSGIMLEFSMPLNAPVRRRTNLGSLKGKVNYAGTNRPAQNVIVNMEGLYAVTNDIGEFHYPNVVAKEYQLQIDNTREGMETYSLQMDGSSRNKVTVKANTVNNVDLSLTQGTRVTGRLIQMMPNTAQQVNEENKPLIEDKGLSMVLIELHPVGQTNGRIIHKRTTLFDGSFSFMGIPPGQWKLLVKNTSRIPENTHLEQNQFMLDLKIGQAENIIIRAIPVKQTIEKTGPTGGFNLSG